MRHLFKLANFLSLTTLVGSSSLTLTQRSSQENINVIFEKYAANKSEPLLTTDQAIEKAKLVNQQMFAQSEQFNNKKQFTQGLNKFEWTNGLVAKMWITKAYLGNVATILGSIGGVIFAVVAMIALILSSVPLAGPILGLIAAILGAGYAAATATLMNKINSYQFGGYLEIDKTIIFSWITILATVREQTKFESAKTLVELPANINFGNQGSVNFLMEDKTRGLSQQFWNLEQPSDSYYGVIDISKFTTHLKGFKVNTIRGGLGIRTFENNELRYDFNKFNEKLAFLKEYFSQPFDYIFVILQKNGQTYNMKIGGDEIKNDHKTKGHWFTVFNNLKTPVKNITLELEKFFIENRLPSIS